MVEQPKEIGRYQVLRELGRGSMGVVYLAYDPAMNRQVAIKTVRMANDSNELIDQHRSLFLEARTAGRLQHPNIVAVHDVGTFNDGDMFIVMEYLSGSTLDAFAQEPNLLPMERVIVLLSEACLALDFAHQQRIVHRDIKPSNLMLVNGRVKITDFGIATDYRSRFTSSGVLLGTPSYMSPEQIRDEEVDGRSDLFSMGVTLYELLTGQRPFRGESIMAVLYQLVHEEPTPPHTLNDKLPEQFDSMLRTALQKDPARRFQTGLEMAAALRSHSRFDASPAQTVALRREEVLEAIPELARVAHASRLEPVTRRPMVMIRSARPVWSPLAEVSVRRQRFSLLALLVLVAALAALATPDYRTSWKRNLLPAVNGVLQAGPAARSELPATVVPETVPGDATAPPPLQLVADRLDARFELDGVPIKENTLAWRPALAGQILSASDGCYRGEIELIAPGSESTALEVALTEPVERRVKVRTTPKGAQVMVDGRELEARTPTAALLSACEDHDVTLSLAGYQTYHLSLPAKGNWDAIAPLELDPLPDGRLQFDANYPVAIYDDQGNRLGTSGEVLSLAPGKHTLRFENTEHHVSVRKAITVKAGNERSMRAPVPGLGSVRVFAYPGNAMIRVDGVDAEAPPALLHLGAGEHRIECHWNLGDGKTLDRTVIVREGQTDEIQFLGEEDLD